MAESTASKEWVDRHPPLRGKDKIDWSKVKVSRPPRLLDSPLATLERTHQFVCALWTWWWKQCGSRDCKGCVFTDEALL